MSESYESVHVRDPNRAWLNVTDSVTTKQTWGVEDLSWFPLHLRISHPHPSPLCYMFHNYNVKYFTIFYVYPCLLFFPHHRVTSVTNFLDFIAWGQPWHSRSALDCWLTGGEIDPAPGAWLITKLISFAQVVPGPVQPYNIFLQVQIRVLKHHSFAINACCGNPFHLRTLFHFCFILCTWPQNDNTVPLHAGNLM